MKTKKFNFDWRSVVLGMVLCMGLVVLVGSIAQPPQADTRAAALQKMATINTIMDKCELIDQRILILEGKINRLGEQMDYLLKNMEVMWRK